MSECVSVIANLKETRIVKAKTRVMSQAKAEPELWLELDGFCSELHDAKHKEKVDNMSRLGKGDTSRPMPGTYRSLETQPTHFAADLIFFWLQLEDKPPQHS